MGLSLVHFHQQAVPAGLWNLCHCQARRAELHPAGERKERGSQRAGLKQQLTARYRRLDFVSRLLSHTYTLDESERLRSETHLLAKYSQRESKVHRRPSDRQLERWNEAAPLKHRVLSVCVWTLWHEHDVHLFWPDIFGIYFSEWASEWVSECVCVCVLQTAWYLF